MMWLKTVVLILAGLACLSPQSAAAEARKYVFALVPARIDTPEGGAARDGCRKAEAELKGAVQCVYVGPAGRTAGEQTTMVADLIARKIDGIAVSPVDAPAMSAVLAGAKRALVPVLTWERDLLDRDRALRVSFVGTHPYDLGVIMARQLAAMKPSGGTLCIQSAVPQSPVLAERMQGLRDTLAGGPSKAAPGPRLTGQRGWTEVAGCPVFGYDDARLAADEVGGILEATPELDAFVSLSAVTQAQPEAFRAALGAQAPRIRSGGLAMIVAGTTRAQIALLQEGLSRAQVADRPFEAGYRAMLILKDIRDGKKPPSDPVPIEIDVCTAHNAAACPAR